MRIELPDKTCENVEDTKKRLVYSKINERDFEHIPYLFEHMGCDDNFHQITTNYKEAMGIELKRRTLDRYEKKETDATQRYSHNEGIEESKMLLLSFGNKLINNPNTAGTSNIEYNNINNVNNPISLDCTKQIYSKVKINANT